MGQSHRGLNYTCTGTFRVALAMGAEGPFSADRLQAKLTCITGGHIRRGMPKGQRHPPTPAFLSLVNVSGSSSAIVPIKRKVHKPVQWEARLDGLCTLTILLLIVKVILCS